MQIKDNKLVFEIVTCWKCKGSGQAKKGVWCPNYGKKMRNKKCPHCGSRSQSNHGMIGETLGECFFCEGTGKIQEDEYTTIPAELMPGLMEQIEFIFVPPDKKVVDLDKRFVQDIFCGRNSFAGAQDYTDHRTTPKEVLFEKIREQAFSPSGPMQALNYIQKDHTIKTPVYYWGYYGGWKADWITFQR